MDWRSGAAAGVVALSASAVGVAVILVLLLRGRRRMATRLRAATSLVEDLRGRQRRALEFNDEIVQGIATAKLSLELDRLALTAETLETTLASARAVVTELLSDVTHRGPVPGALRRSRAALLEQR
jgi:hypothetical protein